MSATTTNPIVLNLLEIQHSPNVYRQLKKGRREALAFVQDYAGQIWDKINGKALRGFELDVERASQSASDAKDEAEAATEKAAQIERYEIGSQTRDGDGYPLAHESTPFMEWPAYDRWVVIVSLVAAGLLTLMGGVNVVVTIMGSGIPIFLDQPLLAYLLGFIVPAIAISAKSGYHLCKLDSDRHRYAVTIFTLSGVTAFLWLILFCLSFEGSSSGIDWDNLDSGGGGHDILDTLRNITQILAEILVGASLFLVVDRTFAKHSPFHITERVGWREMKEEAEKLTSKAEVLREIADAYEAAYHQAKAHRAAFISEAIGFLSDM